MPGASIAAGIVYFPCLGLSGSVRNFLLIHQIMQCQASRESRRFYYERKTTTQKIETGFSSKETQVIVFLDHRKICLRNNTGRKNRDVQQPLPWERNANFCFSVSRTLKHVWLLEIQLRFTQGKPIYHPITHTLKNYVSFSSMQGFFIQ